MKLNAKKKKNIIKINKYNAMKFVKRAKNKMNK